MAAIDLRYARALAAVISDQKLDPGTSQRELNDFADTLDASAELREVLQDPSIPEPQKLKVLDAIAAKAGMSRTVRNVIALITHHERLHELRSIIESFAALSDEQGGVADAEIVSAHKLDDANRKLLEQQVSKISGGQRVRAVYREDAALLGGAVVRLGSTVYDGSVKAQLQQLKQRLVKAGA
jgi:F-type H+-transporting ATPase subunit delta